MERLTKKGAEFSKFEPHELCGNVDDCWFDGKCKHGCVILERYKKLAEYEDLEEQGKLLKLSDIPNGEYGEAIQFACEELIKRPDCLKAVLVQYDSLVKQQIGNCKNMELPYWCYGWGSKKEE